MMKTTKSSQWISLTFIVMLTYGNRPVASVNICEKCTCNKDLTPYLIDCSQQKLQNHFTDGDWQETVLKHNLSQVELDVRFDMNQINHIKRFPELRIKSLSFCNNTIDFVDDSSFADLSELKSLDLGHNNLNGKSFPEMALAGKFNGSEHYFPLPIEFLGLAHNQIHSIDKNLFDHLPYLETLDMSGNPLKVLEGNMKQAISELKNLQVLDLANTSIGSLPIGMLHDLTELKSLDLADNRFHEVPEELSNAHNLTVLILNGNKFHLLNAASFPESMETLEVLEISDMPTLKEIDTGAFGRLKKLRVLQCHNNRKLTKISDGAFQGITEDAQHWPVKEMYLNDNGIHVLHQAMAAWEYVDKLNIQNNPFRCDCNIQWMVETLVPEIQSAKREFVLDVTCREPASMRGTSLVMLSLEHEEFLKCPSGSLSVGLNADVNIPTYQFQAAGVVILAIGVVLIVIGLSILTVLVVKRRAIAHALMVHHQIRYERAEQDEEDLHPYGNPRKF